MFSKEEMKNASNATILVDKTEGSESFKISTDTRTIQPGDVYLPLSGANFNGEDFIKNALDAGAIGYFTIANKIFEDAKIVFKVEDTLKAYLNIARYQKNKLNPITVAVTGSSGKTTTKELLFSVLSQKFKTQKTFSNHNNEIGFCQTVLGLDDDTEVLIVEMGMRGFGEIELISTHLNPDIAVITNSGTAHVGRLGSLDNIAIAKCEITKGLKPKGTFISKNQDIIKKHLCFNGNKIFYDINDVEIIEKLPSYTKFKYKNEIYELNVEGDYNVENSLSAIEVGILLGMTHKEISNGLKSYKSIEKRWEVQTIDGFNFINDSYNANPDSMKASVKTFVELYPNPVVILGNMGELGDDEVLYHKQVGEFFAKEFSGKTVKFLTVGNLANEIGDILSSYNFEVCSFNNNDEVSEFILENLDASYTIFLKASRSMQFEEILKQVKRGICKK